MTTPCLTRQNAFLLEDYESLSPLDSFCGICFKPNDQVLIKPCTCIVRNKSYLAHKKCFLDWSEKNGHPIYCTRCKSKYSVSIGYTLPAKLFFTIILVVIFVLVYLAVHLTHCLNIESIKKCDIQSQYGDETFIHVPEQLILPTISLKCWNSSFKSIPLFFISFSYFTFILIISIILSFLVTNYFF